MNKILEKIYGESDIAINIAIFISAIAALVCYLFVVKDTFISLVVAVAAFALVKFISKVVEGGIKKKEKTALARSNYSTQERDILNCFVGKGTCFIDIKDYNNGSVKFNPKGLDSLVAREVVNFIENMVGPSGFKLSEDVYIYFLKENERKNPFK